jgi:plasmid stabilization system protein ParE
MAFEVLVTNEAFADLDTLAGAIRSRSSIDVSRKWFSSVIAAIDSLSAMPERCPLAPEARQLGGDIRFLLHGRKSRAYKIYFRVRREGPSRGTVQVFHVRHWARKPLGDEGVERN